MSRLIDKDEVGDGYRRWEPPSVSEETSAEDGDELSLSDLKASPLTAEQIEEIQRQAWQEAWEAGFRKGQEEGLAAGREEIARRAALLDSLARALDKPFEELDQAVEQALVDLAVTLAQALVRRELRSDPGQVVAVVREAMGALPVASRHVRVHLHPDDLAVVAEALRVHDEAGGEGRDWRLVEDPTLMRGDCRILSENSQIDATMEKRLAAVVAQLSGGEREADAPPDGESAG